MYNMWNLFYWVRLKSIFRIININDILCNLYIGKLQNFIFLDSYGEAKDSINSTVGVLQGGILSPKLFNEFLSDLPDSLNKHDGLKIGDTKFTHLLYADDIVLISQSHTGLQNLLNSLSHYCSIWRLIVNTSKTKVLIYGSKHDSSFEYNN